MSIKKLLNEPYAKEYSKSESGNYHFLSRKEYLLQLIEKENIKEAFELLLDFLEESEE